MADIAVVGLVLGQAIGRIGCYFGHCCYGIEVLNDSMKWFPFSTQIDGVWHYATFFYEGLCCWIIFGVLLYLIIKKIKTPGVMSGLYFVCYGTIRCLIETLRGDSLYIGSVKVSQLLSGLLVAAGLVMILVSLDFKKNRLADYEFKGRVVALEQPQEEAPVAVETKDEEDADAVEQEPKQEEKKTKKRNKKK